ncbi:hypothetical protein BLNAU_21741 [Blattamonas nauphoetae]|uniref:Uncharacterized protein n=1 Tax=Blattamonas nauphoetae TaxID=2049346 RepID=A0ABQ9WY34_9EUKA|nr:hypothetical protein BLNAU_21741 [Blattamonas nauphoetae]
MLPLSKCSTLSICNNGCRMISVSPGHAVPPSCPQSLPLEESPDGVRPDADLPSTTLLPSSNPTHPIQPQIASGCVQS